MSPPSLAYSPPRSASIPSLYDPLVAPDVAPGLLSEAALYLRLHIPRRSHRSGNVLYPQSFTVRDLKDTLHNYIASQTAHRPTPAIVDALIASLELQSFFYHSTWKHMAVASEDDVCMFLYCDDEDEGDDAESDDEGEGEIEPPSGVFPSLAKCYSSTCDESNPCYTPSCPNNPRVRLVTH
ncbi:hypothetical protein M422DRAFT_41487 [Sphaerobolus stellatus SS14]|nr:hypothetical protein M422DRAFT_41487 [Sphaerobolus stellatus SS14]